MKQKKLISHLFLILLVVTSACSKTDYPRKPDSEENLPDSQLDNATIIFTQDGKQSVVVKSVHIDRWEESDSTEADTVEIVFFDDEGRLRSTLTADRGLIREKKEEFAVFGNVVGISDESTVLRTESLFWDPETELITTDDYVEVQRADGDILTGHGLKADRNLQNIEILRDVAGSVKKLPEEEKEKFKSK